MSLTVCNFFLLTINTSVTSFSEHEKRNNHCTMGKCTQSNCDCFVSDSKLPSTNSTKMKAINDIMENDALTDAQRHSNISSSGTILVEEELKKRSSKYAGVVCHEINTVVPTKNTESTFSMVKENVRRKKLHDDENICVYATDYVDFLDSLPFDSDDIDEEEIEYYDTVIDN